MSDQTVLSVYMNKPEVVQKFSENGALGERAKPYIQSVLIAVNASPDLMKCTNESVFRSALRAASLGLSCDPALKQAWLVPYNRNIGTRDNPQWVKEAQFQPHYKGLYTLAMRTGKYWNINVAAVYEGQKVFENPLTGMHAVMEENGLLGEHPGKNGAYSMDVTIRRRNSAKVIGWLGYFKTKKGFEKSVWMSSAEIADHAKKYVKDYDKNPNWNDADKRQVMEMKTVLRQLLSWADMSGTENAQLVEAMQADEPEVVDGTVTPTPTETIPAMMTYDHAKQVIIKTTQGKEMFMSELDVEKLNKVYLSEKSTDEQREAAAVVLKNDFSMEPPVAEKKTEADNLKDLGF